MAESTFNRKFRDKLLLLGNMQTYRFESPGTCPGAPDNHYICRDTGASGWIEMKQANSFRMYSLFVYRPHQVPWLQQYAKNGGRCWTGCHIVQTNELVVFHGRYSRDHINLDLVPYFRFDLDQATSWANVARLLRTNGLFRGQTVGKAQIFP